MRIEISPKRVLLVILFLLLASYFLFQARFLIFGPQVWIDSPENDSVVESSVVTVSGHSKNLAWISLNGRQIFTDEDGLWSEKLIVSKGVSIMTVHARDRFGREEERRIRIILN